MADHERIWLQHPDDVDIGYRQWWEDKGWPQKTIGDPTEYVRSDLFEALRTRLADIEKSRDIHLRSAATHFADSCRLAARAEAAEARAGRLEKALDKRIEWHRCGCPEPCDDYGVFPGGCAGRYRQDYRDLRALTEEKP